MTQMSCSDLIEMARRDISKINREKKIQRSLDSLHGGRGGQRRERDKMKPRGRSEMQRYSR